MDTRPALDDVAATSRRLSPRGEIAAAIATGGVFLVFENVLDLKLPFLIACGIFWGLYIFSRARNEPGLLRWWGVRRDNLRPAAVVHIWVILIGGAGLLALRLALGWRPLPPSAIFLFALYPIWAFIQQFLVQGLITRNLQALGLRTAAIIPFSAVAFGLAHLPDWPLVGLCVAAGALWTAIFLRFPNLFPLAVSHGWLGALTYYWILERNPWLEVFGPT